MQEKTLDILALEYAEKYFNLSGLDIRHPKAVAALVQGEKEKAVAYLHDVLEDTDASVAEMRAIFGDEITGAVTADTRAEGEDYWDYLERVKNNPLALKVKLADLNHNIARETDMSLPRYEKHLKAYEQLKPFGVPEGAAPAAEIVRIDENSWRVEDNGVRFFVLKGTDRALLIDSGKNVPGAGDIAASLTDLPLSILNTHTDADHISGNKAFEEVYMSPNEEEHYRQQGFDNKIIPVRDGDELELGGRTLRIIDNPGHTAGSIAVLDVNARLLISGDAVQNGNIFMFGAHRDLDTYILSLKRLLTLKDSFDTVWPSHGDLPVSPDIIEKLIDGAELIRSGRAEGKTVSVYGHEVILYKFPFAGFFGEINRGSCL